jgi:hypothetical protein
MKKQNLLQNIQLQSSCHVSLEHFVINLAFIKYMQKCTHYLLKHVQHLNINSKFNKMWLDT